jgi:hypothetical protein
MFLGDEGAETIDTNASEERAGLAANGVPTVYLEACARLNCRKPASISKAEWRLALRDGACWRECGSKASGAGLDPGRDGARRATGDFDLRTSTSVQKYFDSILE